MAEGMKNLTNLQQKMDLHVSHFQSQTTCRHHVIVIQIIVIYLDPFPNVWKA